jgi:protein-tyrosine phosphatase
VTAASELHISLSDKSIKHLMIPVTDDPRTDVARYFTKLNALLDDHLAKGSVLVHCAAGVSRSPTFVIAYLMQKFKWNLVMALEYVRSKRTAVSPNQGFQAQLEEFSRKL